MKLQYRIGKLELDNMELEQSRIVHESAMRGKDLTIQKLQLQVCKFVPCTNTSSYHRHSIQSQTVDTLAIQDADPGAKHPTKQSARRARTSAHHPNLLPLVFSPALLVTLCSDDFLLKTLALFSPRPPRRRTEE